MSRRLLPILAALAACTVDRKIELTPDVEAVVDGNNAFTADLYGVAAAGDDGNLFLSPFSVYNALGMVLAGAEGTTRDEIVDVMYVGDDEASFHTGLGALSQDLDGRFKGYEIALANRLYGQKGYGWEHDFLDITHDDYGAELQEVDYQQDPEGARKDINRWVSKQTRGNIDELVPAGAVTEATRLGLVNAIWFQGDWLEAFEEDSTSTDDFTLADGSTVSVDMMHGTHSATLVGIDGARVIRLPYKGEEISMFGILPDAADGLPAIEEQLDGDTLTEWLSAEESADVVIALPKLDLRQELDLMPLLSDLGMPTAFSDQADLSGMIEGTPLKINAAVHEAWVHVDESGTEAAAGTFFGSVEMSFEAVDQEFIADHPFLFGIRDDLTGAILFLGRVSDPTAG